MSEKHSAVCYIFREGAFSPVREASPEAPTAADEDEQDMEL